MFSWTNIPFLLPQILTMVLLYYPDTKQWKTIKLYTCDLETQHCKALSFKSILHFYIH